MSSLHALHNLGIPVNAARWQSQVEFWIYVPIIFLFAEKRQSQIFSIFVKFLVKDVRLFQTIFNLIKKLAMKKSS